MVIVSAEWRTAYPGAMVGILSMRGVANPQSHPELEKQKLELEQSLRAQFSGHTRATLAALESIKPYAAYYSRYKKTYHVQLQLESIVLKGKSFPRVAALVEAMFMAEVKNQLLTAGHDQEKLKAPIKLDVAKGDEQYVLLNGQTQTLKAGDMMMGDAEGIISSVLYGPDQRTQITANTSHVFFVVYAPPGISRQALMQHLDDLKSNVQLIAPAAQVEEQTILE